MRRGSSFTLIEVLTVMAIIGILVSLTSYIFTSALQRSRDSQRLADLAIIQNGLEQYYLDARAYPIFDSTRNLPQATIQLEANRSVGCQGSDRSFLSPKYIAELPQDPKYKFAITEQGCVSNPFGQYLYYGIPKDTSKQGYYLLALVEREQNINYKVEVENNLRDEGYSSRPDFCDTAEFRTEPTHCSQNYYLSNIIK